MAAIKFEIYPNFVSDIFTEEIGVEAFGEV